MHGKQNSRLARIPCGSGLARDGIAAVYLPDRVVCIAGKPAPTGSAWPAEFTACRIIVGAGLLAMVSLWCSGQTASPASQASQLPQIMHGQQNSRLARIPCGSGLARDGIAAVYLPDRVVCIAGKPAPIGWVMSLTARSMWERACSRCRRCVLPGKPAPAGLTAPRGFSSACRRSRQSAAVATCP